MWLYCKFIIKGFYLYWHFLFIYRKKLHMVVTFSCQHFKVVLTQVLLGVW